MVRDWRQARMKIAREGQCRLVARDKCSGGLEAAHTIGRAHDGKVVDPDDVIPLCTYHHALYDRRQVGVLGTMSYPEQAAAVRHVGLERALHRLEPGAVIETRRDEPKPVPSTPDAPGGADQRPRGGGRVRDEHDTNARGD